MYELSDLCYNRKSDLITRWTQYTHVVEFYMVSEVLGSVKPPLSVKRTMDSLVGLGTSMNWETHDLEGT